MRMTKLWMLCATCVLSACAGNGEGLDENGRPEGEDSGSLEPTFESIQANVLTPQCTGCHAGAAAPLGLRLDEGASHALLVNTPSVEVPALRRVQPGDPDASYLIQKLEGTAAVGGRMPLNAPPLPQDTIAVVRQWIAEGATNTPDASSEQPAASKLAAVTPVSGEFMSIEAPQIVIASDGDLDTALLQAAVVSLQASGGDGNFDSGNERAETINIAVRSERPTVLVISAPMLTADRYELRIRGGDPVALTDLQNRPIDGDGDGRPGGDFVVHFTAERMR